MMTRQLVVLSLLLGCLRVQADIVRHRSSDGRLYFTNVSSFQPRTPPPLPQDASTRSGNASAPTSTLHLIQELAQRHDIEPRLLQAIIRVESNFNPRAVSRAGARGLMQLMPATIKRYGVEDPFDPRDNIEGGIRFLKDLIRRFPGDLRRILAAYNAGEQAVHYYGGVPPYPETRDYVKRVMHLYGTPPAGRKFYRYWTTNGSILFTNVPR